MHLLDAALVSNLAEWCRPKDRRPLDRPEPDCLRCAVVQFGRLGVALAMIGLMVIILDQVA